MLARRRGTTRSAAAPRPGETTRGGALPCRVAYYRVSCSRTWVASSSAVPALMSSRRAAASPSSPACAGPARTSTPGTRRADHRGRHPGWRSEPRPRHNSRWDCCGDDLCQSPVMAAARLSSRHRAAQPGEVGVLMGAADEPATGARRRLPSGQPEDEQVIEAQRSTPAAREAPSTLLPALPSQMARRGNCVRCSTLALVSNSVSNGPLAGAAEAR